MGVGSPRARRLVRTAVVIVAALSVLGPSTPASAQYGGLSGLFVIVSPDDPNRADFHGFGCVGGIDVVLYIPGVASTPNDPASPLDVPGRVLAVTTSVSSSDPTLDGTFRFDDVLLPIDIPRGVYAIHARCGSLDLSVLVELSETGVVVVDPTEPGLDVRNPPPAIAFTGRASNRLISYGVLLVTSGLGLLLVARRPSPTEPEPATRWTRSTSD